MKNNIKVSDVSGFNKVLSVTKRILPQRTQRVTQRTQVKKH
ncbi:conserved hypothetical protein [uncultured Dysgonomonas sp.]|uniref:Uncharacterized protein n=1 Tax=uncultured Dysgonomonas sp. TaxID=206096 RepID=A0A212JXC3_9BACT|nr:conserved hypothetical protein [uncultured Dysgonomonas sp.]